MKQFVSLSAVALLMLSACTATTTPGSSDSSSSSSMMMDMDHDMDMDHSMSSDDMGMMMSSSAADDAASSAAASAAVSAGARVITMTVADFAFSPNTIKVKKGENVVVRLTDMNGTHGFGVADLGINVRMEAGQTKDIVIPTDKAGTFSFRCTIPCGSGHRDMTGTIVIE